MWLNDLAGDEFCFCAVATHPADTSPAHGDREMGIAEIERGRVSNANSVPVLRVRRDARAG